jgi:hypothetical protein
MAFSTVPNKIYNLIFKVKMLQNQNMEDQNNKVCPVCHSAILRDHPEDKKWLKCCLCGYSEEKIYEQNWIGMFTGKKIKRRQQRQQKK